MVLSLSPETSCLIYGLANAIKNFTFGLEKEEYYVADQSTPTLDPSLLTDEEVITMKEPKYRSDLRMMPPPVFSRQGIPQMYK